MDHPGRGGRFSHRAELRRHLRAYLQRRQQAALGVIRLARYGTTPGGRLMTMAIARGESSFDPAAARRAGKPVVLLPAGIHPSEIEGKDAGLMLMRDIAISRTLPHLLDHLVLVYIPVISVDGHENSTSYNRIYQNGPRSPCPWTNAPPARRSTCSSRRYRTPCCTGDFSTRFLRPRNTASRVDEKLARKMLA